MWLVCPQTPGSFQVAGASFDPVIKYKWGMRSKQQSHEKRGVIEDWKAEENVRNHIQIRLTVITDTQVGMHGSHTVEHRHTSILPHRLQVGRYVSCFSVAMAIYHVQGNS